MRDQSDWRNVRGINFDGGGLTDEVYGNNQPEGFGFAEQSPMDAFERAADHLDGHAFVQIRVRVVGQGAFHQHSDGVISSSGIGSGPFPLPTIWTTPAVCWAASLSGHANRAKQ